MVKVKIKFNWYSFIVLIVFNIFTIRMCFCPKLKGDIIIKCFFLFYLVVYELTIVIIINLEVLTVSVETFKYGILNTHEYLDLA